MIHYNGSFRFLLYVYYVALTFLFPSFTSSDPVSFSYVLILSLNVSQDLSTGLLPKHYFAVYSLTCYMPHQSHLNNIRGYVHLVIIHYSLFALQGFTWILDRLMYLWMPKPLLFPPPHTHTHTHTHTQKYIVFSQLIVFMPRDIWKGGTSYESRRSVHHWLLAC
jgi:hypothetical protein